MIIFVIVQRDNSWKSMWMQMYTNERKWNQQMLKLNSKMTFYKVNIYAI